MAGMIVDSPLSTPAPRAPWQAIVAMIGLSLAGLALRLWLGWWMGYLGDLQCWQLWGLDPGEFVHRPEYPPYLPLPNNYPPMYPSVLRIMRWVHRDLHLPGEYTVPLEMHFHEDPDHWRPLILYLKLPPIAADVVTMWLLFLIGGRLGRTWLGVGVAAFYCFSPGILYDGAYFGQSDTILIMFLVAGLWAYVARKPVWLGAMMMAAPLMKAQAVFALPILCLAILGQWRIWRPRLLRIAAGGLACLAIVAGLAAWTGQLKQFHDGYFGVVGTYPWVTVKAYNFWWLAARPWGKAPILSDFPADTVRPLGLISYRAIGMILFAGAMALVLWRLHKARYTFFAIVLAMAAAGWAFFNLPTQMHERYSIPAVGLMTLLPLWGRRFWWPAALVSVSSMLNIAHVGYFVFPPSKLVQSTVNMFIFNERHVTWAFLAVIHMLMLPLTVEALWREGQVRAGGAAPPGAFPVSMPEQAD